MVPPHCHVDEGQSRLGVVVVDGISKYEVMGGPCCGDDDSTIVIVVVDIIVWVGGS